eukprot:PITA_22527
MIIQLDLEKAYDKLSWSYIGALLKAYGFNLSRTFMPLRGLKQGDSLSSFLFVLMMEGLGRAIKMASAQGRIQGLKLTIDGAASTHQKLVDDTMQQGIPKVKEAKAFKQVLNDIGMAVGMYRNLTRILGFQRDELPSKYFRMPLTHKHLSRGVWDLVINKLHDKVMKWTCKSLSLAGHLVLIEVVLQAILIFMMSALRAPKGFMQQIRNIQRNFLWGKGEEKKKLALVSWEKLSKPKAHEGLDLDDPKTLSRV